MHEDEELLERVRALRAGGSGPKQIARALGLRPGQASGLLRKVAEAEQAGATPERRSVAGCWVNAGWSLDLDLSAAQQWAADDDTAATAHEGTSGFAQVLLARQERASKVTVCGFLVDVHCLGVKNVTGPVTMGVGSLDAYRRSYYQAFERPPLSIGVDQAQRIVHGAVRYARALGFEPAPDFQAAATYLGEPGEEVPVIGFGRQGLPFYVNGPYDDTRKILSTLERTRGQGNYHYLLQSGPM
jgi:hypothetical protein